MVRGAKAIGISLCGAAVIVLIALFLAFWYQPESQSKAYIQVYPVTPQPTPRPTLQVINDGKCQPLGVDAIPDWYAAHPGIKQCEFK